MGELFHNKETGITLISENYLDFINWNRLQNANICVMSRTILDE